MVDCNALGIEGGTLNISNPVNPDHIITTLGDTIRPAMYYTGGWNMELVATITVNIYQNFLAIRSIQTCLVPDSHDKVETAVIHPDHLMVWCRDTTGYEIWLQRYIGGYYHNTGWNDTSWNRGWVLMWVQ